MTKRYTEQIITYLSPVEDADIIKEIDASYGYSNAEKIRNYIRNLRGGNV